MTSPIEPEELARIIDPEAFMEPLAFRQTRALGKAQAILDRLSLSREEPVAGYEDGRPAGWTFEHGDGAGWQTHTVLNPGYPIPSKSAPTKYRGDPSIRNVRAFFYASQSPDLAKDEEPRFYTDEEARRQIANLEAAAADWQAKATSANEQIERLRAALEKAAKTFERYGDLHSSKMPPDHVKAGVNYDLAAEMQAALTPSNQQARP